MIAGLGNPGSKYKNTYHNLGFMAMDVIAENLGVKLKKKECLALTALARAGGRETLLIKPQTYMNLSGESIAQAMKKYKLTPTELIVIYDDFDIEPGALRVRASGSGGTHNGMKSIISCLGTDSFTRIRVGLGRSENPHIPIADYVLSEIRPERREVMELAVCRAADAAIALASGQLLEAVMQKYNKNTAL